MHANNRKRLLLTLGLSGALAAGMAGVWASSVTAAPSPDKTLAEAREMLAKGKVDKAIKLAEAAVAGNPHEGSYRALLGQAYLRAGRFASASTAFNDAMKLGDNGSKTALGLALADTAAGKGHDAVAILDDWRDAIPASDLGLALALSGETSRGVAILADAVRGGDASSKTHQNLAYAYALDGRWREARLTLEQDISPEQVDRRLSDWAMLARPDDYKVRVAKLINAPLREDPGQPTALALAATPAAAEQAAAEQGAPKSLAAAAPVAAANAELPAVGAPAPLASVAPAAAQELASYAPVSAPAAAPVAARPVAPAKTFAAAFPAGEQRPELVIEPDAPAAPAPVAVPAPAAAPVRHAAPVSLAVPVKVAKPHVAAKAKVAPVRVALAKPAPKAHVVALHKPAHAAAHVAASAQHLIQLGSFSSAQGARRGWGIMAARTPALKRFHMVITAATVHGHAFWRVAAAGFDARSAGGMCASVKANGGACFAYASAHALPGKAGPVHPMMAKAAPVKTKAVHAKPAPKMAVMTPIKAPVKAAVKAPAKSAPQKGAAGPGLARRK